MDGGGSAEDDDEAVRGTTGVVIDVFQAGIVLGELFQLTDIEDSALLAAEPDGGLQPDQQVIPVIRIVRKVEAHNQGFCTGLQIFY